jgi:response regulator RpfG family c-di-GMP phosphodiesterase
MICGHGGVIEPEGKRSVRRIAMSETGKAPILIVDDEEEILHSLRGLLRMEFEVHTAQSGPEALQVLEQQPIQVVLSDQRMPEMAGVELLSQARGERPGVVRVLFTGYADVRAVINAINHGQIFRYLTKPWDPDELLTVLREASEEYNRRAQERSLFVELQDYQMRCLTLIESLQDGQFGDLTEAGEDEVSEVAQIGYALLDRFDRSLGFATEEGGGG